MKYELLADRYEADTWRVEAVDDEGRCFVVVFTGPMAEDRAYRYQQDENFWEERKRQNV